MLSEYAVCNNNIIPIKCTKSAKFGGYNWSWKLGARVISIVSSCAVVSLENCPLSDVFASFFFFFFPIKSHFLLRFSQILFHVVLNLPPVWQLNLTPAGFITALWLLPPCWEVISQHNAVTVIYFVSWWWCVFCAVTDPITKFETHTPCFDPSQPIRILYWSKHFNIRMSPPCIFLRLLLFILMDNTELV